MINHLRRRLSKCQSGILAEGHDVGRKSFNQKAFDFGCVQVSIARPPRP